MADIESGMGDIPIMEKYKLTPDQYLKVLSQLSNKFLASNKQTDIIERSNDDPSKKGKRVRGRGHLLYRVTVQDSENLDNCGTLNDITEKGLQIYGLPARVGETKSLMIRSESYVREPPIVLEATCRRMEHSDESGKPLAGFEITRICREDLQAMKRIVDELAVIGSR